MKRLLIFVFALLSVAASAQNIHCGDNLQTAIDAMTCGNTYTVQSQFAGSQCSYITTTSFTLPNKSCGSGNPITIASYELSSLPTTGRRLTGSTVVGSLSRTAQIAFMAPIQLHLPKLVTTNSVSGFAPLIVNGPYWKVQGIEITNNISSGITPILVLVSSDHFTIDHSFLHCQDWPNNGDSPNTTFQSPCGVAALDVAADYFTATGSYIDLHGMNGTSDNGSQTFTVGDSGYGTVTNNFIEGGYAAFFSGGSDPAPTAYAGVLASPAPTLGSADPCSEGTTCGQLTLAAPSTGMVIGQAIGFQIPRTALGTTQPIASISQSGGVLTITTTGSPVAGWANGGAIKVHGTHDYGNGTGFSEWGGYYQITGGSSSNMTAAYSGGAWSTETTGTVGMASPCDPSDGSSPCWADAWVTNIEATSGGGYVDGGTVITYTCLLVYPQNSANPLCATDSVFSGTLSLITPLTGAGSQAVWAGANAHDWSITQNYVYMPPLFNAYRHSVGTGYNCKGFFELKSAVTWTFDGNVWDGWPCSLAFNSVNQHGGGIDQMTSGITFTDNWVRRFAQPKMIAFGGEYLPRGRSGTNVFLNNLLEGPDNENVTGGGYEMKLADGGGGAAAITFQHNTVLFGYNGAGHTCASPDANGDCLSQAIVGLSSYTRHIPNPHFTFKDNIYGIGNYGMSCARAEPPGESLSFSSCVPTWTEDHNMLVDNLDSANTAASYYFTAASDFAVKSWDKESGATGTGIINSTSTNSARMIDPTNHDYRLCATAGGNCAGASVGYRTASDSCGANQCDIGVNYTTMITALGPDNPSPLAGGDALGVFTSSLPGGTVSSAYSQTLSATGGTSPYTWLPINGTCSSTLASCGAACAGLAMLSGGAITGTPTTAGTCSFTAQVMDNVSATATQALSIVVSSASAAVRTTVGGHTVSGGNIVR